MYVNCNLHLAICVAEAGYSRQGGSLSLHSRKIWSHRSVFYFAETDQVGECVHSGIRSPVKIASQFSCRPQLTRFASSLTMFASHRKTSLRFSNPSIFPKMKKYTEKICVFFHWRRRRDSLLTGAVQVSYRARFAPRDILNLFESLTWSLQRLHSSPCYSKIIPHLNRRGIILKAETEGFDHQLFLLRKNPVGPASSLRFVIKIQ